MTMNALNIISSVAVAFILLRASFCAAREERSVRNGKELTQLALVQCEKDGAKVNCAGSIPSVSTLLTYCDCGEGDDIAVYAGVSGVSDIAADKAGKQVRKVARVVADSNDAKLKIYHVNETWNMTKSVASVDLNIKGKSKTPTGTCKLVGFGDTGATAHVLSQMVGVCTTCDIREEKVFCTTAESADKLLKTVDFGGPALCGDDNLQWGINVAGVTKTPSSYCNKLLNIGDHSDWIEGQINPAENGTSGGTGENGNSTASSGYSIHSYLNKYSNWKVFGFLASAIVIFLQY